MPYNKKTTGMPNVDRVTNDIYSILDRFKPVVVVGGESGGITDHRNLNNLNSENYYHLTESEYETFETLPGLIEGKEDTGVAAGLVDAHEEQWNHDAFLTSLPSHTHPIGDVDYLQGALDNKQPLSSVLSQVAGLTPNPNTWLHYVDGYGWVADPMEWDFVTDKPGNISALASLSVTNGNFLVGNGSTIVSRPLQNSDLPAIAITDTFVVNSQAAMLALSTAERGDVAVRTDLNKSFILKGDNPASLLDWQELLTPTDAVLSVDGRTGVVSLSDKYQPLDADLTAIAGLTHSNRHVIVSNGSAWTRRALEEADLPSLTASKLPSNIVYTDNAQTISGAKTFSAVTTFASSIIGSGSAGLSIGNNTTDGSDTKTLLLCGGGSYQSTRGATIVLRGNEYSPAYGNLELNAGDGNGTITGAVRIFPRAYIASRPGNDYRWNFALDNYNTFYGFGAGMNIMHNLYHDGSSWRYRYGSGNDSGGVVVSATYNQFSVQVADNGTEGGVATLNPAIYTNLSGNTAFGKNTFVGGYKIEVAGNALVEGKLDVGDVDSYGDFYLRNKTHLLNKAGNGWVDFITRNVSGSEAVADLSNVGSVNKYVIEDGSGKIYREEYPDDYLQLFTNGTGLFSSSSVVLNANYGESPIQLNCSRVIMGRRNVGAWTTINIGSGLTEIDIENYPGVQRFKFEVNGIDAKVLFKNAEAGDEIFVMTDGYGNPQIAAGNSGDDWTFILGQYMHLTCEGNASLKIGAGWYTGNTWIQW